MASEEKAMLAERSVCMPACCFDGGQLATMVPCFFFFSQIAVGCMRANASSSSAGFPADSFFASDKV